MEKMAQAGLLRSSLICLSAMAILAACTSDKKPTPTQPTKPVKQVNVPSFEADSAYDFIAKQVSFGPRVPGTDAHQACADFLSAKLKAYADTVIEQSGQVDRFDGVKMPMRNIIASFKPEQSNRIVLAAHYDTRFITDHDPDGKKEPVLGANDGGSGVGVLLELARLFSIQMPKVGVDIILFDVEDQGKPDDIEIEEKETSWCLGSQYWSRNPHVPNYYAKYGVLLDMVGGENAMFTMEGVSMANASALMKKTWTIAENLGYGNYFSRQETPQILDDHVFMNYYAKIPTIDIIEYDPKTKSHFNEHWHTSTDDMDGISKETLDAVGTTLAHLIYR